MVELNTSALKVKQEYNMDASTALEKIRCLESRIHREITDEYREFLLQYKTTILFNAIIECYPKYPTPFTAKEGWLFVDYFFGLEDSKASLFYNLDRYDDEMGNEYLPLAYAVGDNLFCIGINDVNYGCIYFWHHEGIQQGDDWVNFFKVFDDFEHFISSLSPQKDSNDHVPSKGRVTLSDKLRASFEKDRAKYTDL